MMIFKKRNFYTFWIFSLKFEVGTFVNRMLAVDWVVYTDAGKSCLERSRIFWFSTRRIGDSLSSPSWIYRRVLFVCSGYLRYSYTSQIFRLPWKTLGLLSSFHLPKWITKLDSLLSEIPKCNLRESGRRSRPVHQQTLVPRKLHSI
jgi:hypothetical protein